MQMEVASHIASVVIGVAADEAFHFVADARNISQWSLGGFHEFEATPESYSGQSLIDGHRLFVRIESDPAHRIVHFWTGPALDQLRNLILCRIVPGEMVGSGAATCVLSLVSWASDTMPPARWRQLCASHETEMFILKNRIEQEAVGRREARRSGGLS